MALLCCVLGWADDNVELYSSSGDPVGLSDTFAALVADDVEGFRCARSFDVAQPAEKLGIVCA
jgi:hypothetical protein